LFLSKSSTIQYTKEILQKYNIRPSKKMGQNFLIDPEIAKQQVMFADLTSDDVVLEIGGGIGILSYYIAEYAKKAIVIEKDKRLCEHLKQMFSTSLNVEIICDDALKIDLPKVDKVISNLPYSISSDILFKIINETQFKIAILMLQEEFIERILAKPGDSNYGRLSIGVKRYCDVRILRKVSKYAYFPVPKVDSTIIELIRKNKKVDYTFEQIFYYTVKGIFNFPRKTVRAAIVQWLKRKPDMLSKVLQCIEVKDLMEKRVRHITIEDIEQISKCIQRIQN